jgi:hypothetical protein
MLRTVTAGFAGLRLLLVTAIALLAAACDGIPSSEEPPVLEDGLPAGAEAVSMRQDLASLLGDRAHLADGYLVASNPVTPFYTPASSFAFNRSGGSMTFTKLEGTTGRPSRPSPASPAFSAAGALCT